MKEGVGLPKQTFFNLKEEKKEKIIQVAIDEFAAYDFTASSINRIVANAGISKGSFYQYFEDKMDIFLFILKNIGEEKLKYMQNNNNLNFTGDFFDVMKSLYVAGIEFAILYPKCAKIGENMIKTTDPDVKKETINLVNSQDLSMFTTLIEDNQAKGILRKDFNKEILMKFIVMLNLSITDIFISQSKHFPDSLEDMGDFMKYVDELFDIIKYGVAQK